MKSQTEFEKSEIAGGNVQDHLVAPTRPIGLRSNAGNALTTHLYFLNPNACK